MGINMSMSPIVLLNISVMFSVGALYYLVIYLIEKGEKI